MLRGLSERTETEPMYHRGSERYTSSGSFGTGEPRDDRYVSGIRLRNIVVRS